MITYKVSTCEVLVSLPLCQRRVLQLTMPILWYETLQSVLLAQLCGMIHLVRNKQLWLKSRAVFDKVRFSIGSVFQGSLGPSEEFFKGPVHGKIRGPLGSLPRSSFIDKQIKDQNCLYVHCGSHFTEYFQNLIFSI